MLTKDDKKFIEEITVKTSERSVNKGLIDFWENVLEPYLSRQHGENDAKHIKTQEQIETLGEHIKDHEKRIRKLETVTGV